jgi:endonuclease/exonuclease/phosphatase family metal-dependent hydrolase
MNKNFAVKGLLLVFAACSLSCASVQFYNDPNKCADYFSPSNYKSVEQGDSLNVVTFNIKKARKIELAISELRQFEKTQNVDVYLLQEMDEKGVEAIAKALELNYLYIPIVYDKSDKKNIGNAILTKGAIECPQKLILPHAKWQNKQRRHVTIGEVTIHQKKILVYSVHTETLAMSRQHRIDQIDGILDQARIQSPNYKYVLIGGDFNTLLSKDGRMVVDKFTGNGFDWSTAAVGTTARAAFGLIKPRHDYLFSRGLKLMNTGKIETSVSSDHYPVFATYQFKG